MALTDQAIRFLDERGIEPEVALALGIDTTENGVEIVIPFFKDGQCVNRKYRTIEGKEFRQDRGGEQCFWNYDILMDDTLRSSALIITEGELDAIAAIQAGYPAAVSVPGGAPSEHDQDRSYHYLDTALPLVRAFSHVVLATDGDAPGRNLHADLSTRIGRARCKYLTYPEGAKDLNDVLRWDGAEGVRQVVEAATWVEIKGVYTMSQLPPIPEPMAYPTRWTSMNKHYNVRKGDLCVVSGIPGRGKTTWVTDLCCGLVQDHGWHVTFACFETPPQTDHLRHLTKWYDSGNDGFIEATGWIEGNFGFIYPGVEDLCDLRWVLDMIEVAAQRHGTDVVVIDPWNELDHDRPKEMSETEYVSMALKELRMAARRHHIHMIVVAHPTKLPKDVKVPTLYNISASAAWANKPEVGIIVHRLKDDSNLSEISVKKSRYHDLIGRPGVVPLWYDSQAGRFYER